MAKGVRTCQNCGREGEVPDVVEYYWAKHPIESERLHLIRLCRGCNSKAWDVKRQGFPTKKFETQKKFTKRKWG